MDPLTLAIVIATGAVAAGGLGAAVPPLWRHQQLRKARELVTRPIVGATAGGGAARSVYDLFGDLGGSEYAIEVLRHLDLIPDKEDDLERVAGNFSDAISSFGGYDSMVASLKDTINDLHEEAGREGRARLTLVAPISTDSLLPAVVKPDALPEGEEIKALPEGRDEDDDEDDDADHVASPAAGSGLETPSGDEAARLHATVDEALAEIFGSKGVDRDALTEGVGSLAAIVIGGVLGSLTTGGFWDGVSRFVQRRRVNQMRTKLSQELASLSLAVYHASSDIQDRIDRNLEAFVQGCRWQVERQRRATARHKKLPKEQRSTAQLALKLLAAKTAREDLTRAQRDIRQLRSQITRHRRAGRHDLAGFLLFVNREILLAGISDFDDRMAAIESAGEQLREVLLAEDQARDAAPAEDEDLDELLDDEGD